MKPRIKFKMEDLMIPLFLLYCFYSYGLAPYFTWETFAGGTFNNCFGIPLRSIIAAIIVVIGLTNVVKGKLSKKSVHMCIWCMFTMAISIIQSGIDHIFSFEWLIYLVLCVFLLIEDSGKIKAYRYFYNIFVFSLIAPIIIYILVHIGVNVPYIIINAPEEIKTINSVSYKIYPLAAQWYNPYADAYRSLRLCGIYNECGVVGTYSALLLSIEGYRLKGNWKNIVLLIGGILSFSLAFYFLTICYFIVRAIDINWKYMVPLIIIVVIYIIFVNVHFANEALTKFQNRFLITDYVLNGDNRTSPGYDRIYENFIHEGGRKLLFGNGLNEIEDILVSKNIDGSSYKNLIFDYGIFGFFNQIIWIVVYFIYRKIGSTRKEKIYIAACCFVFIANMYQRPSMFALQFLLPLIGGIIYQLHYRPQIYKSGEYSGGGKPPFRENGNRKSSARKPLVR